MYKSCNLIQHGLCFFDATLVACCYSPVDQIDGQKPPLLAEPYNGEIIPKEELFERLYKYADVFKDGGCPKECVNCYKIEEKDWTDEKYIDQITVSHYNMCNVDCIYCSNNLQPEERKPKTYDIYPVLKHYIDEGVIKKGCELHIGGGEFSIYKEANELLDLFALSGFGRVFVATNGLKYLEKLSEALNKGNTFTVISLDSGTRKTYKKVKRVDGFDKVVENLSKYASTENSRQQMRLKYIIIPGVNDNMKEFKSFLKVAKKLKIPHIIIDIEGRYSRLVNYKVDNYFIDLALQMEKTAAKQGFITELYQFFTQNTNKKDIKKNNFIVNFIKSLKYKYFSPEIKELYLYHNYDVRR